MHSDLLFPALNSVPDQIPIFRGRFMHLDDNSIALPRLSPDRLEDHPIWPLYRPSIKALERVLNVSRHTVGHNQGMAQGYPPAGYDLNIVGDDPAGDGGLAGLCRVQVGGVAASPVLLRHGGPNRL